MTSRFALKVLTSVLLICAASDSALSVESVNRPLADTSATPALPATASVSILPTSNQWVFDRPRTFIFLSVTQSKLFAPALDLSQYSLDFNGTQTIIPKLIADLKIVDLSSRWSLAGRYDLGFTHRDAALSSSPTGTLPAENADLMAIELGAGLTAKYELTHWLVPFAGYSFEEFFYRVSSSLSGADAQGTVLTHGPLAGFEFLSTDPDWKLAGLLTYQRLLAPASQVIKGNSDELTAGLGWFF